MVKVDPKADIKYYASRIDEILMSYLTLEKTSPTIQKYLDTPVNYRLPSRFLLSGSRNLLSWSPYRDNCGNFIGLKTLESTGAVIPLFKSCSMLKCPVCVVPASATKAGNITYTKVMPFQQLINKYNLLTMPAHFVLSADNFDSINKPVDMPDQLYEWLCLYLTRIPKSYRAYSRLIEFVWSYFLSPYLHSAIIVYHPDRVIDDKREISPHFHVVGWTIDQKIHQTYSKKKKRFYRIQNFLDGNKFFNRFGVVFSKIGDLKTLDDVRRCFTYLLSHTVIYTKKIYRKPRVNQIIKAMQDELDRKLTKDERERIAKKVIFDFKMDIKTRMNKARAEAEFLNLPFPSDTKWTTVKSVITKGAYWYKGMISPYNMRKIGSEQEKYVADKDDETGDVYRDVEPGTILVYEPDHSTGTPEQHAEWGHPITVNNFNLFRVVKLGQISWLRWTTYIFYNYVFRESYLKRDDIKWLTKN